MLGLVSDTATPTTSAVITTTAGAASTRMARRCAERVKEEDRRRAVAPTKSAVAALKVSKPISSNFGAVKNSPINLYSTRRRGLTNRF